MYLATSSGNDSADNKHYEVVKEMPAFKRKEIEYIPYCTKDDIERYRVMGDASCVPDRIADPTKQGHVPVEASAFIGQVPNLLPLAYLAWAIDTLCQMFVVEWVTQTSNNGCARVWLWREFAPDIVTDKTHRVLFDIQGAYFARTAAAADELHDYSWQMRQGERDCDPRLPRGLLVIEKMRPMPTPREGLKSKSRKK